MPEPKPRPKPKPKPAKVRAPRRPGGWGRFFRALLVVLFLVLVVGPLGMVVLYRFLPPPITILMVERLAQGQGLDHRWRPLSAISPAVPRAAIAAEDARFCAHHGFDMVAVEKAIQHNQRQPGRIRGGSTISQQTAKNVFLWPERSWVRKGLEAYFTVLIEAIWGKPRIMEVYLNTVEMGPGIYGVEAASQRYFGVSASNLSPAEASRLVAILPSPLKWQAINAGPYVRRRTGRIDAASGAVRRDGLSDCLSS